MCVYILVPTPDVAVTPTIGHILGQSLTLQCEVTTVRGITSRVDIVWSDSNGELNRTNGTAASLMGDSLVYTGSYTISQLNESDEGRVIQCEVVINSNPLVMADNNVTLDVMGMYIHTYYCSYYVYIHTAPTLMVITSIFNNQVILVGNTEVVTCTVSGAVGVSLSSVMISWTGPGGANITIDSRVTIGPTTSNGNNFLSTLRFEFLMEGDEGIYTCNVTILDTTVSAISDLSDLIGKLTVLVMHVKLLLYLMM